MTTMERDAVSPLRSREESAYPPFWPQSEQSPFHPLNDQSGDIRGDWIGCEEAARIVGIGRTQMWRLADKNKIPHLKMGTITEDLTAKVAEVGADWIEIPKKLPKRWQLQPVKIGRQTFHPVRVEWVESYTKRGQPVVRDTRLYFGTDTGNLEVGMAVTVPQGKLERPEYKFNRRVVEYYRDERRARKSLRQRQRTASGLEMLIQLCGRDILKPTLNSMDRRTQRQGRRVRGLTHPLTLATSG